MQRVESVIEVRILLDPVPGWGSEPEDHVKMIKKMLDDIVPHYLPTVALKETNEVATYRDEKELHRA